MSASKEVESPVALRSETDLSHSDTSRFELPNDENSPFSPREIQIMRNQPKVTTGLLSPSRKLRGDSKIKPKSFSSVLYSSPSGKTKTSQKLGVEKEKRKTLQVLQPAANGDGTLVGSRGVIRQNETKLKIQDSGSSSSSTVRSDSSDSDSAKKSVKKSTKSLESDVNEKSGALMVSDPPPERYWELLAEERRLALQEALEENERLHKELEEMKEKNKALEEIAGQAEYFASLYQMVMEGEVPEEQSSDEGDKPEL
ncbi:geminin-like isoform X3 [Montipora foliosa]|uniref:geminin-like isoform X3 n=1 Tax=Montipora foliosa TaxID=591990 RepID=UPI0035F111E8